MAHSKLTIQNRIINTAQETMTQGGMPHTTP